MRWRAVRPGLVVAFGVLVLAGCSWLPDEFGGSSKPPLPGERISVLALEKSLEPDPRIADLEVRLPRPYVNTEWPQAGGYPNHAMYHLKLGDDLKRIWRSDIGAGSDSEERLPAAPVVADGKLFVMDSEAHVSGLNAETGERLWRVSLTPAEFSSGALGGGVAYDHGRVYVTTGYGDVFCLDAATGKEVWKRGIGIPLRAAPTVEGNRVFAISYDNQLHALNLADGTVVWTFAGIAETAALVGAASPAVDGGIVIAPFSSGELVAMRADNGRVAWNDSLIRGVRASSVAGINDISGRPVIDRGRVIAIGHSGRMLAIDLRSGERIWEREVSGVQAPWVAGEFIYLVTEDAEVLCLSRRDGRIRWVRQIDRYERPKAKKKPISWYGPVLASDRLILVSSQGYAVSVSPYTGEVLGEIELSDDASVAPIVANDTLYILTDDGYVAAYR